MKVKKYISEDVKLSLGFKGCGYWKFSTCFGIWNVVSGVHRCCITQLLEVKGSQMAVIEKNLKAYVKAQPGRG